MTRPRAPSQTRRPRPKGSARERAGANDNRATRVRRTRAQQEEAAGAVEPYRDAVLYDWEYRRRRDDVAFYRMLAAERGGPVLDLGCGTGRLLIPLAADGTDVVGVDLSASMLRRARDRRRRAEARRGATARAHPAGRAPSPRHPASSAPSLPPVGATLLLQGDLRALPVRGAFPLVIMAFHTIQHFVADDDLLRVLRTIRDLLGSDGWFAFDVFAPHSAWLARPSGQRFGATVFRHPATKQRLEYSFTHRLDRKRRALHITFRYRPMPAGGSGGSGGNARSETTVRLCHRQLAPREVESLLARAGLKLIGRWGGFHDEPLDDGSASEQHVYLARPAR